MLSLTKTDVRDILLFWALSGAVVAVLLTLH